MKANWWQISCMTYVRVNIRKPIVIATVRTDKNVHQKDVLVWKRQQSCGNSIIMNHISTYLLEILVEVIERQINNGSYYKSQISSVIYLFIYLFILIFMNMMRSMSPKGQHPYMYMTRQCSQQYCDHNQNKQSYAT